jgi:hypothetical protein
MKRKLGSVTLYMIILFNHVKTAYCISSYLCTMKIKRKISNKMSYQMIQKHKYSRELTPISGNGSEPTVASPKRGQIIADYSNAARNRRIFFPAPPTPAVYGIRSIATAILGSRKANILNGLSICPSVFTKSFWFDLCDLSTYFRPGSTYFRPKSTYFRLGSTYFRLKSTYFSSLSTYFSPLSTYFTLSRPYSIILIRNFNKYV